MKWGLFFLFIILLFLALGGAWVIYTQVRARRAGLPPPSWRAYIPFTSSSSTYRDSSFPSPRRGGVVGWFKDKFSRARNQRTHRGAYEDMETGRTGYGRNEHDEVWDSRGPADDTAYGHGGGQRGYDDEHDFEFQPTLRDSPYRHTYEEPERGRSRSRDMPPEARDGFQSKPLDNPFGDNAESSELRNVSPRPDANRQSGRRRSTSTSSKGKRSAFQEDL